LTPEGSRSPADLPRHIERRLRFALVRFSPRVERIVVFLQDRNGPKGGVDKVCRILAKVKGCGVVMATIADSDWMSAVDRAASRVGHTVARQLSRLHDRRGTATPRRPAVSLLRATRQPRPG
jgi:putative sigma-54 modulation protein